MKSPSPRPLWSILLWSGVTGLLYYGWYKWIIQEELRAHKGEGWSGTLCLAPFLLGVTVPPVLVAFDPDVPHWFGYLSILGLIWIYIVQFRLYCDVNALYREEGLSEPLVAWWLVVPGLKFGGGFAADPLFKSVLGAPDRSTR